MCAAHRMGPRKDPRKPGDRELAEDAAGPPRQCHSEFPCAQRGVTLRSQHGVWFTQRNPPAPQGGSVGASQQGHRPQEASAPSGQLPQELPSSLTVLWDRHHLWSLHDRLSSRLQGLVWPGLTDSSKQQTRGGRECAWPTGCCCARGPGSPTSSLDASPPARVIVGKAERPKPLLRAMRPQLMFRKGQRLGTGRAGEPCGIRRPQCVTGPRT